VSSNIVGQVRIDHSPGDVVSFTIPVYLDWRPSDDQWRVGFLVGSIDVPALQRRTDLLAIEALAALMCLFLCVAWLVWYYSLRINQQREVLDGVSRVMEEADTPFAWTDERNQFVSANNSFINLLGFESLLDLRLKPGGKPRTFYELLAPDQRENYLTLLREKRPSGRPYVTEIITKSGSKLRVVVRSDSIPFPGIVRRSLPHRFGIFIRWNESRS
jgi:PAS domain-containing protein